MTNVELSFLERTVEGDGFVEIITAEIVNLMNQTEGQDQKFEQIWDTVITRLEEHNKTLIEDCSSPVKKFINDVNLFNCPVHCRSRNFLNDEFAFVIGSPPQSVYSIGYEIIKTPVEKFYTGAGFDENDKASWLYDEFHKVDNHYVHHILFSDGYEVQIPFVFFHFRVTNWFEV